MTDARGGESDQSGREEGERDDDEPAAARVRAGSDNRELAGKRDPEPGDSETDDLPVGTVRREWNPAALVRQDIRIAECEERYKSHAIEAAERLISRLREL